MKSALKMLLVAGALAFSLGGCAAIQNLAGNSPVAADALKGVKVAITTYADVYQPAVIAYGNLQVCPNPTPSGSICRNPALHAKLKAVDLAASKSIAAAQAVLEGTVTDTGQITQAIQAIASAEGAISAAGVLLH